MRAPSPAIGRVTKAEIVVREDLSHKMRFLRMKQWMQEMANLLGASCQNGTLKELTVRVVNGQHLTVLSSHKFHFVPNPFNTRMGHYPWNRGHIYELGERVAVRDRADLGTLFQYCLEPLAGLSGVPTVNTDGDVDPAFAAELAMLMRRRSNEGRREVPKRDYRITKRLVRPRNKQRRKAVYGGTRFFYEPELDWNTANLQESQVCDDRYQDKRRCGIHKADCLCKMKRDYTITDLLNPYIDC